MCVCVRVPPIFFFLLLARFLFVTKMAKKKEHPKIRQDRHTRDRQKQGDAKLRSAILCTHIQTGAYRDNNNGQDKE